MQVDQSVQHRDDAARALSRIKTVHTVVWLFFVATIVAIPVTAFRGRYLASQVCIAIVAFEVAVLLFNGWRCPLTAVAARYTQDRRDNFDIYLPEWLAKYNKSIFGTLYLLGTMASVAWRFGWLPR